MKKLILAIILILVIICPTIFICSCYKKLDTQNDNEIITNEDIEIEIKQEPTVNQKQSNWINGLSPESAFHDDGFLCAVRVLSKQTDYLDVGSSYEDMRVMTVYNVEILDCFGREFNIGETIEVMDCGGYYEPLMIEEFYPSSVINYMNINSEYLLYLIEFKNEKDIPYYIVNSNHEKFSLYKGKIQQQDLLGLDINTFSGLKRLLADNYNLKTTVAAADRKGYSSIIEMYNSSDIVCSVKVLDSYVGCVNDNYKRYSYSANMKINTISSVEIIDCFKGDFKKGDKIDVMIEGGLHETFQIHLYYPSIVYMEKDNEYLIFLYDMKKYADYFPYQLLSPFNGKYSIENNLLELNGPFDMLSLWNIKTMDDFRKLAEKLTSDPKAAAIDEISLKIKFYEQILNKDKQFIGLIDFENFTEREFDFYTNEIETLEKELAELKN